MSAAVSEFVRSLVGMLKVFDRFTVLSSCSVSSTVFLLSNFLPFELEISWAGGTINLFESGRPLLDALVRRGSLSCSFLLEETWID